MTRYLYRRAIGGLFHVDRGLARAHLPPGLVALGLRLDSAIVSVFAFDFVTSEAGPFTELALMLLVPPDARPGRELAEVGMFPIFLGTSTAAAAALARERLRLPVHPENLELEFSTAGSRERVDVRDAGGPILSLEVERRETVRASRLFQCFVGDERVYQAPVRMQGWLAEHEDETGRLELCDHPLVAPLAATLADDVPLREQIVDGGQEDFGDMQVWR